MRQTLRFSTILLSILFAYTFANAQDNYFQQVANYNIDVTLDDVAHTLDGTISIEYTNNSPDELTEIWMHLWPNAFKNSHTAFCKQKLSKGSTKFYFSEEKERGRIEGVDFSINGTKVAWKSKKSTPDIAKITLNERLKPGATCTISTPFSVKIPASFSRLGHVDQSYQITQWYPKPAVYDHKGWHAMPYLDMGEFYSEFGGFKVKITLPANYVVGATGELWTASEIAFLEEKVKESNEKLKAELNQEDTAIPVSSKEMKTLLYTASMVHDFAWFADKRFYVQHDTAVLASGKMIDCWAMFTNFEGEIWKKGAFYTKRAVEFYSEHVGEYPWPQATAVQSALSAGGGMEYPMVTVIGPSGNAKSLDEVITHEVGHNWFYGILASNERIHPFMDEGMNTYYENRYMNKYYGGNNFAITDGGWQKVLKYPTLENLIWTGMNSIGRNRPPDSHSNDFSEIGYGLQVYAKTGILLNWLEQSVGTKRMDRAMKKYYETWKFRHPYPEDFRSVMENEGLEVEWLFEQLQGEKTTDYAIVSSKKTDAGYRLILKNNGESDAPIEIAAMRDTNIIFSTLHKGAGEVNLPIQEDVDYFVLDPQGYTLDANRGNNRSGMKPIRIGILKPFDNPKENSIGILPLIGGNYYDKLMVGAAFYNPIFPVKKFQYFIAPAFATGSKNLVGVADFRYRLHPKNGFSKRITLGLSGKSFTFDHNDKEDVDRRYYRAVPFLRMDFRTDKNTFRHWAQYRTLFIGTEGLNYDSTGIFTGKTWNEGTIHELKYQAENRMLPNPWTLAVTLEQQSYKDPFNRSASYLKSSIELNKKWYYAHKKKVTARLFGGYFLQNTERNTGSVFSSLARGSFALTPQNYTDYKFDEIYFGRSEQNGLFSLQTGASDGGFKNAFGSAFSNLVGNSNNYILALNLRADLPKRLPFGIPLKPYFDIGYYDDASPLGEGLSTKDQIVWSGGFALSILRGGVEVYFPLINSSNIRSIYKERIGGNYLKWISWRIHIPRKDVVEVIEYNLR